MEIRILSAPDVQQALPMARAVEIMRQAFGEFSAGRAVVPLRTRIETDRGTVLMMPAYLRRRQDLGFKAVSIWPENPGRGLPSVTALAVILDAETGQPRALLDGEGLTALRTGAGDGLAADLLARPEASIAAVFGAGVQARAQLRALLGVRDIEEARIVGRDPENAERFAAEVADLPGAPAVSLPDTPEDALDGADVIVTATTSENPVFDGGSVPEGAHVTAVGAYTPTMQEVDEALVSRAKIVVDSLEACLAEAGDLAIPIRDGAISESDIHGELGDVVNGDIPGRESDLEITLFKSVGLAVQDVAAAAEIVRTAEDEDLGLIVEL